MFDSISNACQSKEHNQACGGEATTLLPHHTSTIASDPGLCRLVSLFSAIKIQASHAPINLTAIMPILRHIARKPITRALAALPGRGNASERPTSIKSVAVVWNVSG
jgi:hypothetical protein